MKSFDNAIEVLDSYESQMLYRKVARAMESLSFLNNSLPISLRAPSISNGFPCSVGGTVSECDGDAAIDAPEASSSDGDDDGGGDNDPDPDRRPLCTYISSGKLRDATATVGTLSASPELLRPQVTTGRLEPAFPPLESVNRPIVPTEQAAFYLLRRPQTLRAWACTETYPDGLRPIRIGNRLGWPVDGIRRTLGVA